MIDVAPWVSPITAYSVLLLTWWAHVVQPHRLGDEDDDRPLADSASAWPLALAVPLTLGLQVVMVVHWVDERGAAEQLAAAELAGLTLVLVGAALRRWAIATLGRLFTFELGVRSGHVLVESGPYAWIRHPGYAGTLLIAAGTGLYFGEPFSGGAYVGLNALFFARRIPCEDRMLKARFGEAFDAYVRLSNPFHPKITGRSA